MDISFDIEGFNREMVAIQKGFAEYIPKVLQAESLTLFAKIRNRIQEKGIDSNGKSYPLYSQNELPTFFFEGKATNGGGRNAIKKANNENRGLSYEEFKSANNGPKSVQVRNLTFTGQMWRGFGITDVLQEKTGIQVVIEGETQGAKDKARWNAAKIGDFLQPSQKEDAEITADFQESIDEYFRSK